MLHNVEKAPSPQMLCLIGESFDGESVLVNGAVVNVRNRVTKISAIVITSINIDEKEKNLRFDKQKLFQGDKISMWLCEAKPQEAIVKIGQTLKKRLGIDDKVVRFLFLIFWSFLSSAFLYGKTLPNLLRSFLALSVITTQSTKQAPQQKADTRFSLKMLLITITNLAASSWFPLSPSNNINFPSLFQILAMHRNLHTSGFSILTKKISHFQVWKPPLKKLNSSSISFSSWLLIGQTTATADCLSNQHSTILKVMSKKTWS